MAIDPRIVALGREADRKALASEIALQEAREALQPLDIEEAIEATQRLATALEAATEAVKAFRNAVLASKPERE